MDKFSRMIMGARRADVDSIRELKDYIYEASGIANKSLRALEKAGYTEFAYGRAMTFLNTEYQSIKYPVPATNRPVEEMHNIQGLTYSSVLTKDGKYKFPQAVANRPVDELIKQALQVHSFLSSKTRTVRGARNAWESRLNGINFLRELGYNVSTDKDTLRKVSKIMGNDTALSKDYRYKLMEHISNALEDGATEKEVQLIMDRYQTGEIIYDTLLEEVKELGGNAKNRIG